jgi:hypothetical protein
VFPWGLSWNFHGKLEKRILHFQTSDVEAKKALFDFGTHNQDVLEVKTTECEPSE